MMQGTEKSGWMARLAVAGLLAWSALSAAAVEVYPARPIRIVVASAPGSGPDIIARLIGKELTAAWAQQVVVDNRPGAGGNIGAEIAARAEPDGYTLLMATANHAIGATLYRRLGYDIVRDFSPVSLVASTAYVLVVTPALPAKSVAELIALAKSKPGAINYGSGGSGSPPHLCAEIFKAMAGINLVHVPYRGVTPALADLAAGRVQLVFSVIPAALPLIKTGRVRALGVSGKNRSPLVPDVPTIAGTVPGFGVKGWYGLLVPAGTPKAVVLRLNAAVNRALRTPELEQRLSGLGAEPIGTTPQAFAAFLRAEIRKWGKAVRESGARVE